MSLLSSMYAPAHDYGRLAPLRGTLRARYEAWRVYRKTRTELSALSDRELDDLGLSRSSIPAVSHEAAYGK